MFKSSDGARTWEYIGTGLQPGSRRCGGRGDRSVDPNTVWYPPAAIPTCFGPKWRQGWEKLDTGIDANLVDLAIDPSDPMRCSGRPSAECDGSVNGGQSWCLCRSSLPTTGWSAWRWTRAIERRVGRNVEHLPGSVFKTTVAAHPGPRATTFRSTPHGQRHHHRPGQP